MAKRLRKRALKSNYDPYPLLLDFRNTPRQCMGTSPAQRLISRRTKTLLPTKESLLVPEVPDKKEQEMKLMKLKERQSHYYNRSAKDLEPLKILDPVRIGPPDGIGQSKEWKKGVVTNVLLNRSYKVQSDCQHYQRNRRHLKPSKHQQQTGIDDVVQDEPTMSYITRPGHKAKEREIVWQDEPTTPCITRAGRDVKELLRFKDYYKRFIFSEYYIWWGTIFQQFSVYL